MRDCQRPWEPEPRCGSYHGSWVNGTKDQNLRFALDLKTFEPHPLGARLKATNLNGEAPPKCLVDMDAHLKLMSTKGAPIKILAPKRATLRLAHNFPKHALSGSQGLDPRSSPDLDCLSHSTERAYRLSWILWFVTTHNTRTCNNEQAGGT